MSLVPLAAEAIRAAVRDIEAERDLDDRVNADPEALQALVMSPISPTEIRWMSPSEWRWYADWRQGRGGPLDEVLLRLFEVESHAPLARFRLRALVMRNRRSIDQAENAASNELDDQVHGDLGLDVMRRQVGAACLRPADSIELVDDSLQIATAVSWFTIRRLVGADGEGVPAARDRLQRFAAERDLDPERTHYWFGL